MTFQVRILKCIDAVAGRFMASFFLSPSPGKELAVPTSILVIRPGGIGDAALLIPALQTLKHRYPDVRISILAERRNAAVFHLCPDISQVLCYDRPGEFLSALRGKYEYVIDTEQSHYLSALITRMIGSGVTIGFAGNSRSRLFHYAVPYRQDDYEILSFFRLLEPLGIQALQTVPEYFLHVPAADRAVAETLTGGTPYVCIFPGASIAERRWGGERFHALAALLHQFGIPAVIIGGGGEKIVGEQIVAGGIGSNQAGRTTLPQTAAILEKAALLVTADSGMLHLAVGLGKSTVSLFGPGRQKKWAPQGNRHIVLNKQLPCSPCTTFGSTPSCRDDARCMKEITVDEVFNAVTILLTETGVLQRACCKRDMIEVVSHVAHPD